MTGAAGFSTDGSVSLVERFRSRSRSTRRGRADGNHRRRERFVSGGDLLEPADLRRRLLELSVPGRDRLDETGVHRCFLVRVDGTTQILVRVCLRFHVLLELRRNFLELIGLRGQRLELIRLRRDFLELLDPGGRFLELLDDAADVLKLAGVGGNFEILLDLTG